MTGTRKARVPMGEQSFMEIFSPGSEPPKYFPSVAGALVLVVGFTSQIFSGKYLQGRLPLHGRDGKNNWICDAVSGTPADNTHASWTVMAVSDLNSLFLKTIYYDENVLFFLRNGYRKFGTMILRIRGRDTALK